MSFNKVHTKEQMLEYATEIVKRNISFSQDGHPDEGRMAKRLSDGSYLISDDFNVYIAHHLKNDTILLTHIYNTNTGEQKQCKA